MKFDPPIVRENGIEPVLMQVGDILVKVGTRLFTMNELLVPLSEPPVLIAEIVNVPPGEMVTLLDESTPATKAGVVPLPEDNVPVDVTSIVPV